MIEIQPGVLRLAVLAGAALLLAGLALYARRRRRVARALGDPSLIRGLLGVDLAAMPWIRLATIAAASAALAGAILDPSLAITRSAARGPVVLLLDASGSMLVEDVGGARIELQRAAARQLVEALPEVPIGVVAYAGRAYTLTPPTRDRTSVEMYLATLDPGIVTQTGSSVSAAIRQGIGLLAGNPASSSGTLVLIGDGDDTGDGSPALEAADLARRNEIVVHTIGVGSEAGGTVPAFDPATGESTGTLTGPDGQPVISRVQNAVLEEVAARTGGEYLSLREPASLVGLSRLTAAFEAAPTSEPGTFPRYAWLAIASLILLAVEPLTERRERR